MYSKLHLESKEEEDVHASFLVSAAKYANSISSRVLKSHLNILSYETLRMKNFLRGKSFKKTETCQYCLTNWKNGDFSLKILHISKKQQRMKKIFRNIAKNKPLVKIEKKLADARNIKNAMLVKCLVCTKETKFKLRQAYTLMGVGGRKTSLPGLSFRSMKEKMKKKTRVGMKTMEKKFSKSHPGVNSDHGSGFPLQQASEGNSNQRKLPGTGQSTSHKGDESDDEIEIMFERRPPEKNRTVDYIELDQEEPAKKRNKKETNTTSLEFGVLDMPSSTPYNTPGAATYNTPLSTGCATPYNMHYNTPYGVPYSTEYSTPYNNQTYATPYNASYNLAYDDTYANYNNYSAVGYIPLDTGTDTSKKKRKRKKKKGAPTNQNSENNVSVRDLILNPFCDKFREIFDLSRMKKLSKWKKLISEEENKSTQSPSLKDFLDKLQRG